ncbi:MAG: long-chain-fatty-acid--CoA ligase [Selenomonadaceae bacterium]|nr:long-chain-fatty-acid--CoA ligase [Selenomonadaceae bacterium]
MLLNNILDSGRDQDIAIVDHGRRFTYEQFKNSIRQTRNKLYELGIRQGDRVAIFSRNSAEFIFVYFAVASLGAINVPINFQLSHREIAYILKDAGVEHIFTYKPLEIDDHHIDSNPKPDFHVGLTHKVHQHDIKIFDQPNDLPDAPELPKDFSAENPCVIIYTSGTTGNPKGAVLSHKNLVRNAEQMINMGCESHHKVLCVLPMYHCFSWTCSVLYPLSHGAAVVILDSFTPKETIETIRTEKITDMYVVPSICSLLTKLATTEDMQTLRLVVSGGTTLPLQIANDFIEKFNVEICEGYGLSEASPVVTMNPYGKPKVGSAGPIIPDIEYRFVDNEGNDVKQGTEGELIIKGDNVMIGYWNMPDATKEAIDQDGWLHTGDIAKIDEDGYVFIVNRLKEMIISMGENIYPREVEEVIYKFPGIKDAAVIGVEDKLRGQAGACFYSMQDGAEMNISDLKHFLQKNLALYKIPREFHQLDDLPRTSTGKIFKRKILDDFLAKK